MVAHIDPPQTWYDYTYAYPDGYIEDGIDLTDVVFYVGKGTNGRIDSHEQEAKTGCRCLKCREIRAIWARGYPVKKRIVFETLIEREALAKEEELLKKHAGKYLANVVMPKIAVPQQVKKVRYLNAEQAARELGISAKTIQRYIQKGRITATYKHSQELSIAETEIDKLRKELKLSDPAIETLAAKVAYLEQKVAALEHKISRQGNL